MFELDVQGAKECIASCSEGTYFNKGACVTVCDIYRYNPLDEPRLRECADDCNDQNGLRLWDDVFEKEYCVEECPDMYFKIGTTCSIINKSNLEMLIIVSVAATAIIAVVVSIIIYYIKKR